LHTAVEQTAESLAPADFHVLSPDGARLACSAKLPGVDLFDLAAGKVATRLDERQRWNHALFTPDGTRLVFSSPNEGIRFHDCKTGKLAKTLKHDPGFQGHGIGYVSFSPDGKLLAYMAPPDAIHIWDVHAGKRVASVKTRGPCYGASFAPDNRSLLFLNQGIAEVHSLADKKMVHHFSTPYSASFVTFTPDGKRALILATAHNDKDRWRSSLFIQDVPAQFLAPRAER
jgi:WD40 repeat protein